MLTEVSVLSNEEKQNVLSRTLAAYFEEKINAILLLESDSSADTHKIALQMGGEHMNDIEKTIRKWLSELEEWEAIDSRSLSQTFARNLLSAWNLDFWVGLAEVIRDMWLKDLADQYETMSYFSYYLQQTIRTIVASELDNFNQDRELYSINLSTQDSWPTSFVSVDDVNDQFIFETAEPSVSRRRSILDYMDEDTSSEEETIESITWKILAHVYREFSWHELSIHQISELEISWFDSSTLQSTLKNIKDSQTIRV